MEIKAVNEHFRFPDYNYNVWNEVGTKSTVDNNYWDITVYYYTSSNESKSWRISFKNYAQYKLPWRNYSMWEDEKQGTWEDGGSEGVFTDKDFVLEWCTNGSLVINGPRKIYKAIPNVSRVYKVSIGCGASAQVKASLKLYKETIQSRTSWYMETAQSYIKQNNYGSAAAALTDVISQFGISYPLAYFYRGYCYLQQQFYKTALDDFNMAVSYSKDVKDRQQAYYYRGVTKLALEDLEGAVEDLKYGGQEGAVLLREYDLESALARQKAASQRRRSVSSQGSKQSTKKPSLTK